MRKRYFIQGYRSFYFGDYRWAVYEPGRWMCSVAGLTWEEALAYVRRALRCRPC